jgi:hypothetical protein
VLHLLPAAGEAIGDRPDPAGGDVLKDVLR